MRVRDLTPEERARWGVCPVCKAPDGEPCKLYAGRPDPQLPGAHWGRLERAPLIVKEPSTGDQNSVTPT